MTSRIENIPEDNLEKVACPLCGENDFVLQFKRKDLFHYISQIAFDVVKCKNCFLVFVNPRPDGEEIHRYYPPEFYKANYNKEEVLKDQEEQLKRKWKYVSELKPGRLLDIGCQKGEFLYFMQHKGWDVKGMDFSSCPPNLFGMDIKYGQLADIAYPEASFDLITVWAVLEHVYGPLEMLKEINRILKPGGKAVILVTNFNSIPGKFMRHDDIPRHTTLFTAKTLRAMLEKTGFDQAQFQFDNELFGGKTRGVLNFIVKRICGEKMDEILEQNRSSERWGEFAGCIRGKKSRIMEKIDRYDQRFSPKLDWLMDRLGLGFIMIGIASKTIK